MPNQQEDGAYPRINGSLLSSGKYTGMIVSLVGCVESFDGSIVRLQCADKDTVNVVAEPDFAIPTGSFVELIGAGNEDKSLQLFVTRELSSDMDLDIYNQMITQVQQNERFAECGFPATPA